MKIITNSTANTFNLCEQRYCWNAEYGLRTTNYNFPMEVGSMVHEGLDHLLDKGLTEQHLDEAKHDVLARDKYEEEDEEALMFARFMLDRYFEHYSREPSEWVEVISTEETMGYPLNDEYWYFGKVDGLVRDQDGNIWILEHKSTYSIDSEYLNKVKLDSQITRYMLMVKNVLGIDPDGVIYNVLCRPRKYRRNNEGTKTYLDRNIEEYRTRPKEFMKRQKAFRNPEALDRAKRDLLRVTEEIEEARDRDFWVRNTGVCFLRSRKCPYTELCKRGMRPQVLSRFNVYHPELDLDNALIPDDASMEDFDDVL